MQSRKGRPQNLLPALVLVKDFDDRLKEGKLLGTCYRMNRLRSI